MGWTGRPTSQFQLGSQWKGRELFSVSEWEARESPMQGIQAITMMTVVSSHAYQLLPSWSFLEPWTLMLYISKTKCLCSCTVNMCVCVCVCACMCMYMHAFMNTGDHDICRMLLKNILTNVIFMKTQCVMPILQIEKIIYRILSKDFPMGQSWGLCLLVIYLGMGPLFS